MKAKTLYRISGIPVLADDSGLSVLCLDGAPGIYSARYGSSDVNGKLSDFDRNAYLLKKMEGSADRRAFFVCCLVLMLDEYRYFTVQETFPGIIAEEPRGTNAFGYDPVFYVSDRGKMLAELSPAVKNSISHRGKAGTVMAGLLSVLSK